MTSRDPLYGTALNAAADKGHVAVAELLIARGVPLEGERFGETALQIATEKGHAAFVELLRSKGAKK
jgi:ankyrin repeat protein